MWHTGAAKDTVDASEAMISRPKGRGTQLRTKQNCHHSPQTGCPGPPGREEMTDTPKRVSGGTRVPQRILLMQVKAMISRPKGRGTQGVHVLCHSRARGSPGKAFTGRMDSR